MNPGDLSVAVEAIIETSNSQSWKAKVCVLEFLQVMMFTNLTAFIFNPEFSSKLVKIVMSLLEDPQLEVREKAGKVLGGFFHCSFIQAEERDKYIESFQKRLQKNLQRKKKDGKDLGALQLKPSQLLIIRHSGSFHFLMKFTLSFVSTT